MNDFDKHSFSYPHPIDGLESNNSPENIISKMDTYHATQCVNNPGLIPEYDVDNLSMEPEFGQVRYSTQL